MFGFYNRWWRYVSLRDVRLELAQLTVVTGANGTGKSSFLRIIAGTATPDDGKVWHTPGLKLAVFARKPVPADG